ncbi:MAG: hypothetical protein WDW38_000336 [Sanguina aurantia]
MPGRRELPGRVRGERNPTLYSSNTAASAVSAVSSRAGWPQPNVSSSVNATRHEVTFLNVFRLIQALVYVSLAFTPMGLGWPQLANFNFACYVTGGYLLFAMASMAMNRRRCADAERCAGRALRATEALAEQRSIDLANMAQVNELIIRRMKTGVLLVDDANRIHQINESAWMLLGNPGADQRDLGQLAPELSRRLYHWMTSGSVAISPLAPRCHRQLPRRRWVFATGWAALGRLSASIAHEIRNPLAAIRYSAQLLAESKSMDSTDQRMVEIINNHCIRLNEIIENILQLSRRERSRPETLDLADWAQDFVAEYCEGNDLGADSLRVVGHSGASVAAVADPQQLQQVVWNLVQNALRYGRLPGEPARVMVVARQGEHGVPILEMSEANQAALEYVRVAGGGSCFRLILTPATGIK